MTHAKPVKQLYKIHLNRLIRLLRFFRVGESGASCNIFTILVIFQVIINFMDEVILYSK